MLLAACCFKHWTKFGSFKMCSAEENTRFKNKLNAKTAMGHLELRLLKQIWKGEQQEAELIPVLPNSSGLKTWLYVREMVTECWVAADILPRPRMHRDIYTIKRGRSPRHGPFSDTWGSIKKWNSVFPGYQLSTTWIPELLLFYIHTCNNVTR